MMDILKVSLGANTSNAFLLNMALLGTPGYFLQLLLIPYVKYYKCVLAAETNALIHWYAIDVRHVHYTVKKIG